MVHTAEEVDQLTEHIRRAGARVSKEPVDAEFFTVSGALVFRSFLALSLVRGPWGHAGDEWFVDLGG